MSKCITSAIFAATQCRRVFVAHEITENHIFVDFPWPPSKWEAKLDRNCNQWTYSNAEQIVNKSEMISNFKTRGLSVWISRHTENFYSII